MSAHVSSPSPVPPIFEDPRSAAVRHWRRVGYSEQACQLLALAAHGPTTDIRRSCLAWVIEHTSQRAEDLL